MTPSAIASAFRWACALDVGARKAGNVSWDSPGHGMAAELFIASADAAAAALCAAGASVGDRIEAAVRASLRVAGCNTNLGIVLLCAPLAAAAERLSGPAGGIDAIRGELRALLRELGIDDAAAAFRAIRLANPGGLGSVEQQDVGAAPGVDLRAAMALAAGRDLIAAQYVNDFELVFGAALQAFVGRQPGHAGWSPRSAMLDAFLTLLASRADSHIVRKHGDELAQCVMREAAPWLAAARAGSDLHADPGYARWDTSLKSRAINPGTSADLCVATAMLAHLAYRWVRERG